MRILTLVIFLLGPLTVMPGVAAGQESTCGIRAVYAAAKASGLSPDPTLLNDPRFVSSRMESSLADLVLACDELGVPATVRNS